MLARRQGIGVTLAILATTGLRGTTIQYCCKPLDDEEDTSRRSIRKPFGFWWQLPPFAQWRCYSWRALVLAGIGASVAADEDSLRQPH